MRKILTKIKFTSFIIVSLFFVSLFFVKQIRADSYIFNKISILPIASNIIEDVDPTFPRGDNVLLGTNQIPFSLPFINGINNYYNSSYGGEYVKLNVLANSPDSVYFLMAGGGTSGPIRRGPEKFGEINLIFSDGSTLKTDLFDQINLREWTYNNPADSQTTSDPNVEEAWRSDLQQTYGTRRADLLTINIDQSYKNKTLSNIEFKNTRVGGGFHIYGVTIKTGETTPSFPIVFIPGFGGSWSYKGLIENLPTTNSDWQLMPFFTDGIYQPLFSTLHNAGVNPLIFAYDFRKSVHDSAVSLNSFLTVKSNIVAHSMGGLVARECYENVVGCADKINKIVTAGSPNQGTLKAYNLWEAGQFDGDDLFVRTAEEIALHSSGFPYLTDKDIIQNKFPGVHDLLPNNFSNYSANFLNNTTAFSGNQTNTMVSFTPVTRTKTETVLGLWADGKPGSYTYGPGDNTVLQTSSQLPNVLTKYYNLQHNDYFINNTSLSDLLNVFNLTAGSIVTTVTRPSSILSFIIHSPATISVNGNTGIDGKAVFIYNPTSQNYNVVLTGTGTGSYQLDAILTTSTTSSKKTFTGKISPGTIINVKYNDFLYDDPNAILASFRQKSATMGMRNLSTIEASVVQAVKAKSILALEKTYVSCLSLLVNETTALNRQNLKEACGQIFNLTVRMNQLYGSVPTTAVVNAEIARAQKAINLKLAKTSLLTREALNIQLAQQQLLAEGSPYSQRLLATGAIILAN